MNVRLRGRIASGRGDLAQWMSRYAPAYERAAGVRLVPGSLNVVLDHPWVMREPESRLEPDEVGVGVGFVACRLDGVPCFVVRTDRNNAGQGDHPLDVVEVVAAVHLRTHLALVDGDEVVVELDAPAGIVGRSTGGPPGDR